MSRVLRLLTLALALSAAGPARAEPPAPEAMVQVEPDLAKRVRDLQTRIGSDAELLAVLLEAQRALLRSDDARARGDLEGAQRAEAIARASIALAERRWSLQVERALVRAATARRDQARVRAETAAKAREAEARRRQELSAPAAGGAP